MNFVVQVLLDHALPVRRDVQPLRRHVFDLVLALRDDHRHVGGLHAGDLRFEIGPCRRVAARQRGSPARPDASPSAAFTLSYIRTAVALSMQTTIALPAKPRPVKCATMSAAIVVQPVVAGDQVVLAGELALQLGLLRLVQLGVFQHGRHVVVQVVVGQLQLGDAVFVVERHRGAVVHRLLEVVDADVIAEDLRASSPRRPSAACR